MHNCKDYIGDKRFDEDINIYIYMINVCRFCSATDAWELVYLSGLFGRMNATFNASAVMRCITLAFVLQKLYIHVIKKIDSLKNLIKKKKWNFERSKEKKK